MMKANGSKTRKHEHSQRARESASAVSVPPVPSGVALLDLQQSAGNRTMSGWLQSGPLIQTKSNNGGSEDAAERQADDVAEKATESPQASPAKSLIADDEAGQLQTGQMRKSEFLGQLRSSVCSAAEEALKGTMWSAMGCPYIDRWFNYFNDKPASHVERALLKYTPNAASVKSARDYIPIVTQRVRQGIAEWSETGKVTGLPEEFAAGGMPGASVSGLLGGALSAIGSAVSGLISGIGGALSSVGKMLFKRREGETREAEDPQAIRDQLGAGQPLDGRAKGRLQSAFGADFSDVRVHTDSTAQELSDGLNAHAFTIGSDIAFGPGEYQPGTVVGDTLIAHELAHVMQQAGSNGAGQPQRKASDSELDADADQSALGAMLSLAGGAVVPQTKPRRRSGLSLQRCGGDKQEPAKTAKTEQKEKPKQAAEIPGAADDWDFTPKDYADLASGGKKLRVSSDSAWFPAPLQENLLATLNYLLGPTQGQRGTEGINIRDFYHGHVVIKKQNPDEFLATNVASKLSTYFAQKNAAYSQALGGKEFNLVTNENLPAFNKAVQKTLPAATDVLNEALKEKGVAVVYHTFEEHTPSDVAATGGKLKSGSPRRNYVTPLDTNKPEPYSPPDPDKAPSYTKEYSHVFEFGFLIDRNGEVHIRPESIRELSTVTGKSEDK